MTAVADWVVSLRATAVTASIVLERLHSFHLGTCFCALCFQVSAVSSDQLHRDTNCRACKTWLQSNVPEWQVLWGTNTTVPGPLKLGALDCSLVSWSVCPQVRIPSQNDLNDQVYFLPNNIKLYSLHSNVMTFAINVICATTNWPCLLTVYYEYINRSNASLTYHSVSWRSRQWNRRSSSLSLAEHTQQQVNDI